MVSWTTHFRQSESLHLCVLVVYLPIYILFLSNHSTFDMSLYVMLATEKFGSPVIYLENAKFDQHAF